MSTIGKEPISADCPQGTDTRYEPAFEELQAEIDKLGSPSASGGIHWNRVTELAEHILSRESKDLLVGSYFAVSQIYIAELDGLETGLQVFGDLLKEYWDTMFPKKKRMRGRVAAVEWWVEKSASALESLSLQAVQKERKEQFVSACEEVKTLCNELFPDPPDFGMLIRVVAAFPVLEESSPAPAPAPPIEEVPIPEQKNDVPVSSPEPQSPPAPSVPAPAPIPQPVAQQSAASGDEAVTRIQQSNENIKRAALALLGYDAANPLGHRSLRMATWGSIDVLPQAVDGKTIIPPPEPHVVSALQDLAAKGDWMNLATVAGSHFPQFIFWLDLQRYCAVGLENMGLPYGGACEAVCMETAHFLKRMPGLVNLQFAGGFPFADEETRDWCQSIGGGGDSLDLGGGVTAGQDDGGALDAAMQKAAELLKERKLIEAVELLQEGLNGARFAREAMQWRLGLVRILINGKKPDIAFAHCEKLAEELTRYKVDYWDPAQALTVYKTAYLCVKMISSKMLKEKGGDLLDKIARLDSAEAIRMVS